jgi:hypothetical protein
MLRIELDTAERFFRFSEPRFQRELRKLEKEEKSHSESYWNENLDFGTTRGDLLSEEYSQIREMQRLNRYFGVILVYSALDRFLFAIYRDARRLGLVKDKQLGAKPYLDFKGYVQVLRKDLGIDVIGRCTEYAALNKLRNIRNVIAHDAGWVHSSSVKKLKQYGFKTHQQIELPEGYFSEIRKLVMEVCSFVSESYREKPFRR